MKLEMCETPIWQSTLIWAQIIFNAGFAFFNMRIAVRNYRAGQVGARLVSSMRKLNDN